MFCHFGHFLVDFVGFLVGAKGHNTVIYSVFVPWAWKKYFLQHDETLRKYQKCFCWALAKKTCKYRDFATKGKNIVNTVVLGFRGAKKHRYLRCFLQVSQQKSENATYLTIFWSLQDSEKTAGVTLFSPSNFSNFGHFWWILLVFWWVPKAIHTVIYSVFVPWAWKTVLLATWWTTTNNNNNNNNNKVQTNTKTTTTTRRNNNIGIYGNNNKQVNNKQQTTNSKQTAGVTTNNKQQTTNNKQQTTNNKQQTTNNNHNHNNKQQTTTNNQQPTTNNQQPTTEQAGDTLGNNSNPSGIPGVQSPQKKKKKNILTYIFIWGK